MKMLLHPVARAKQPRGVRSLPALDTQFCPVGDPATFHVCVTGIVESDDSLTRWPQHLYR